jgi:branched-chain amino acid aminotransferase
LAKDLGFDAEERLISVEDWQRDLASGELSEVFACGTAAVVTPVGEVKFESGSWTINGGESGRVALQIREKLLAIQHGVEGDPHGWMHSVA